MKTDSAKVVVRYTDGRIAKGTTLNFDVKKPGFLLRPLGALETQELLTIRLNELKAVFFVRDFAGDPDYTERKEFDRPLTGRRMAVRFADGERLVGVSLTYDEARDGFFLFPADANSNNERVYILKNAVVAVERVA